ncbi:1-aminocyclopropane-1-carboxylate synthase 1 [Fusarium beomiforme]|uniref:1-aminocyclopropane-1-carboxylate synthase 1 n=1 Tax=Fusarium beomiforme TaxID=44412 RepID=A0A9P5AB18_9HYPO|nr:1-aminocyclopropane-1-carboxylate synthase 1 [Fusarium beomiforme]
MSDQVDIHSEAKALGEKNKEHFDRVAAEVFKHPWIQNLCNQISDELRENLDWIGIRDKPNGVRMLDYACGNGVASRALAPYVTVVRGMDISSKMVEQYNMLAELSGFGPEKMRAIHGDLMDPEATPSLELDTPEFNNFDVITMCMALHHVEDYAGMIQKLSNKLAPGGVLLIIDLVSASESGCPEPTMAKELSNHTMSKMGFTELEVKTAFDKAGLGGWSWKWLSKRSKVPEEIGGEQQGFFARGYLTTAENWLIRPELQRLYKEAILTHLTEEHLSYERNFGGDAALLKAASGFFNTYFKPYIPVLPEHIVATPGATSCLDALLFSICDEGDIVLIPAPYWSLWFRFPFQTTGQSEDSASHNKCYREEDLKEAMGFCQKKGLHYISDELYAMSDLNRTREEDGNGGVPFTSALSLACENPRVEEQDAEPSSPGSKVHVIWSLTSVYTLSTIHTSCLSSIAATHLLNSENLPSILHQASTRLEEAHQTAIARFRKWGTPFVYPHAGPYITVKLVKQAQNLEQEEAGLERLKEVGVMVARLRGFGGWKEFSGDLNYYGWVRIIVAIPKDRLVDALDRIADAMKYEQM